MRNRNAECDFLLYINKHVQPPIDINQYVTLSTRNSAISQEKRQRLINSFEEQILSKYKSNQTNPSKFECKRNKTKKPYVDLRSLQLDEEQIESLRAQTEKVQKLKFPHHYVAFARLFYRSFKDSQQKIIWDDRKNSVMFKYYLQHQLVNDNDDEKSSSPHDVSRHRCGKDEKGRQLYKGSKGGAYYRTASGNKVYVSKTNADNHKLRDNNYNNNNHRYTRGRGHAAGHRGGGYRGNDNGFGRNRERASSQNVRQSSYSHYPLPGPRIEARNNHKYTPPKPPMAQKLKQQLSKLLIDQEQHKILRLIEKLNKLSFYDSIRDHDEIRIADLSQILDGFQCVLDHQLQNELLQLIFNHLDYCDVCKCISFQRNYRNRSTQNDKNAIHIHSLYKTDDDTQIAYNQLFDKIHCFFHHSYDIGNRLSIKERNKLKNVHETQFVKTSKIIKASQNCIAVNHIRNSRKYQKFHQLITKDEQIKQVQKAFIFGCEFHYDSDEKQLEGETVSKTIHFSPKYRNQKEELTENEMCRLTLPQYNNENTKAQITCGTYLRKKYYPKISQQHLLSLMVYCNFDELQYEFSKTYRDHSGIEHNNFYHFGRLLKEAVLNHGTEIRERKVTRFYHGITQQLVPTEIVGDLGKGVAIFCPLSTSTSYTVAVNTFTNQCDGVVIEFGGERSKAKYFNVAWLSDYANENECLFLQNRHELRINNITDCRRGCEYKHILTALKTLDSILAEDYYQDDKVIKERHESMQLLLRIIQHQMSQLLPMRMQCELNEYEKQLVNVYFRGKTILNVNYSVLEQHYTKLCKMFCHKEWINVIVLSGLFPNVKYVTLKNIHLSHKVMDDVLKKCFLLWELDKMVMGIDKRSKLSVSNAVSHYEERFNRLDIRLTVENGNAYGLLVEKK